jgi:predicted DNA-binding transcriptional regulator AlpA
MSRHLVSIPEIAEILGVSQQRVHQLIASYEDFPAPEADLAVGRVWSRTPIDRWVHSHPRKPGRPRGSS